MKEDFRNRYTYNAYHSDENLLRRTFPKEIKSGREDRRERRKQKRKTCKISH